MKKEGVVISQAANETPREIERKFLLERLPEGFAQFPKGEIEQGYLAVEKGGVQVRLRKRGDTFSLGYKRGTKQAREEREIELSAKQFDTLWPATAGRRLLKVRHDIPWQSYVIEVDVYRGRHEGLVVAEVEFTDEESCRAFVPPEWIGEEVTGDSRYSNVLLAQD